MVFIMMFFLKTDLHRRFSKYEEEMKKIVKTGGNIEKSHKSKQDAITLFDQLSEPYKSKIIKESDQNDDFQIYHQENTDFYDLCRGPHLPNLRHVGAFKLTKLMEHIGKVTQIMKCYKEFMAQHGEMKRN